MNAHNDQLKVYLVHCTLNTKKQPTQLQTQLWQSGNTSNPDQCRQHKAVTNPAIQWQL